MRSTFLPALALAVCAACTPAADRAPNRAEDGSPETGLAGGADTSTPANQPAAVTTATMLSQLSEANTSEIKTVKSATPKLRSPELKRVAKMLVTDHGKNEQEVKSLAQKVNVELAPTGAKAASDSAAAAELASKSGSEFERAFVDKQIEAHQANIDAVQSQMLPAASNEEVRSYLQKTLASLKDHLASLEKAKQQLQS